MTDKQLLELAAKAASMPTGYADGWVYVENVRGKDWGMYRGLDRVSVKRWNPLTDDGDALRLAVKLNITVHKGFAYTPTGRLFNEVGLTSYLVATRRAIVRAAAEIGKGEGHA